MKLFQNRRPPYGIPVLPHRERASAGGLEARGAVALRQAEDALGSPQPIEGTLPEQARDERGAARADVGGPLLAPDRRLQQEAGKGT